MIYALEAIETALNADTVASPLIAGSSTTVLRLGAGQAALWTDVEHVNITGTGATLANNRDTRRVISVDQALDRVTVDRAFDVAPAAGDVLGGGYREWVVPPAASPLDKRLYYAQRGEADHPAAAQLKSDTSASVRCVVIYGELTGVPAGVGGAEERWRFRVFSRVNDWATACAARIGRRLDGRVGALTIPGRQVFSIEMSAVSPQFRSDVLIQKDLRGVIITAKAAA